MELTSLPKWILDENLSILDIYSSCQVDHHPICNSPLFWFYFTLSKNPTLINGILMGGDKGVSEEYLKSIIALLLLLSLYLEKETSVTLSLDIVNYLVPSGYLENYIEETEDESILTTILLTISQLKNGMYLIGGRSRLNFITDEGVIIPDDWEPLEEVYLQPKDFIEIIGMLIYSANTISGDPSKLSTFIEEALGYFESAPFEPEDMARLNSLVISLLE